MDVQLDKLIEKLKKEGINEGQEKAAQILHEAETKAAAILAEAKQRAEQIVAEAEKKAAQLQASGELAIRHAARDSELLLKGRVVSLFDRVFRREIVEILTPDFLKDMILRLVESWSQQQEGGEVEIVLNPEDVKRLETVLFQGLKKEMKNTIILTPAPEILAGFRIGLRGRDVYYDFTDESIAAALKSFLSPRIKEILDGKDG